LAALVGNVIDQSQTMSLMSWTWLVRCLSTNILDAPLTVFLHV
jgi:hypothetical protein